jgi:hypothetical protein
MPPVNVAAAGANRDHLTRDIPEQQVLEEFVGDAFGAHHRLLLVDCGTGRWIVASPTLDVYHDDLTADDMSIVPLRRNSTFPVAGRPFFTFGALTEIQLAELRTQAQSLARIMGVAAIGATAAAVAGTKWLYSDPAVREFSTEVPSAMLAHASTHILRSVAVLPYNLDDGTEDATTAERVADGDFSQWLAEKRGGAGRDPRLGEHTPAPAPRGVGAASKTAVPTITFCRALELVERSTEPPHKILFGNTSPNFFGELADALLTTGVEPMTYAARWEAGSGVSPNSPLAREHRYLIIALWLFLCRDRVNGFKLAGIEHLARRILQIEKAVQSCPRAPNFDGLESYMQHCADTVAVQTPAVDTFVAAHQKDRAFFQKQSRLAAEEAASRAKRESERNTPNNNNKGKPPKKEGET